jgi:sensor histidine kinase YesM
MGIFGTKYRYGLMILLAGYSYLNADFSEVRHYYPIPASGRGLMLYFLVLTLLIWEGNRLIGLGLRRRSSLRATSNARVMDLGISFLISVLYSGILSAGLSYACAKYGYQMNPGQFGILVKLGTTLGTRINLFLQVVNIIFFISGQLRAKEQEAEELRRVNAQTELQAIRSQVNPHFLFNNLNVLSALIMQERPEAQRFIEDFSAVYRHVLNAQQRDLVSLKEELDFLEHYLFLLRQRFPDSIHVRIMVGPGYQEYRVASLAVQMLIENAVKHNIATRDSPLELDIKAGPDNRLSVENNLQPRTVIEESSHLGLLNIDQRYVLLSGQHIDVVKTENRFTVLLPLLSPANESDHY